MREARVVGCKGWPSVARGPHPALGLFACQQVKNQFTYFKEKKIKKEKNMQERPYSP